MRIAYLMYPTSSNLATCSIFNWAKHFVATMIDRGHFVYWCAPRRYCESVVEHEPEFIDRDGMHWVDIDSAPGLSRKTYHFVARIENKFCGLFDEGPHGRYFYDLLLNGRTVATSYLKSMVLAQHSVNPAVYNMFGYIFSHQNQSGSLSHNFEECQAFGLPDCNHIFTGQAEADMLRASAKKYLNRRVLSDCFKPERVLPNMWPLNEERLKPNQRSVEERRKHKKFTFNFANAENASAYRFDELAVALAKMFQSGRDMKFIITATSKGQLDIPEHMLSWKGLERYVHLPQLDFFKKIQTAHGFLVMDCLVETNPSILEQFYLGLVGVVPDKPWIRRILPPDYPYMYHNTKEMQVLIRRLADTYYTDPTLPGLVRSVQEHISQFTTKAGIKLIADHMESEIDARTDTFTNKRIINILKRVRKKTLTHKDLLKIMEKHPSPSRLSYSWALRKLGWVDDHKSEHPRWTR